MKCWFPGGSSAPVLLDEHLDLPYTFEAMAEAGSMLGSGAIIVVDDSQPIVPLALRLAGFYRHESCGKCVPCREGTNWTVKMLERIDEGDATPMDLEIMAEVQTNIIGNCLCVLGDSMAMPIGSMIKHFRAEFESTSSRPARPSDREHVPASRRRRAGRRPSRPARRSLARPSVKRISFEIDGREVRAPEGTMLVDAAKSGDVEIPYFCYEPKLGQPVGACRMCLVEIEGMPKLQTSCSTPVKDGMVVNTTSDRVKSAQNAVVEFLLINHPLDCPVCDKGGECPLQDISYGWGGGKSRFIEPKRHFTQAAGAVAAGGHRPRALHPLLPLRALLPGGGRGLPAGVPRARRPHLRGHPRRPPVRGPVQRQHHRAVPGGRAHLAPPTASARARGTSRSAGSICTLCPSQCNVRAHDPRRLEGAARPARATTTRSTTAGCATRAASATSRCTPSERLRAPMVRDGGALREVSWERALGGGRRGADQGGRQDGGAGRRRTPPTRRASCSSTWCARRSARRTWTPRAAGPVDPEQARVLARPDLSARVSDIDHAGAILVVDTELVEEIADRWTCACARPRGATAPSS